MTLCVWRSCCVTKLACSSVSPSKPGPLYICCLSGASFPGGANVRVARRLIGVDDIAGHGDSNGASIERLTLEPCIDFSSLDGLLLVRSAKPDLDGAQWLPLEIVSGATDTERAGATRQHQGRQDRQIAHVVPPSSKPGHSRHAPKRGTARADNRSSGGAREASTKKLVTPRHRSNKPGARAPALVGLARICRADAPQSDLMTGVE